LIHDRINIDRNIDNVSQREKDLFFLIINGKRGIRQTSVRVAREYINKSMEFFNGTNTENMIVLVILAVVAVSSFVTIVVKLRQIQRNKYKIIELYTVLTQDDIEDAYTRC